jgi:hypothetical protein
LPVRIGPDAAARLEAGSALVVGSVAPDGTPHASRAWGAIVGDDGASLRVMLDGDDHQCLANLVDDAPVAVTGGNVMTLASVQVKGTIRRVEELTALDQALRERATDLFLDAVCEVDRQPRELLDAMVPDRFIACVVDVDEIFDQSPGPGAGGALHDSSDAAGGA